MPSKSYWDNNWLVLSCRLTEGGISMYGEFPCFMTMELQQEAEGWEVTFHKNATARDVETLIGFCSDGLGFYPVRNVGTK